MAPSPHFAAHHQAKWGLSHLVQPLRPKGCLLPADVNPYSPPLADVSTTPQAQVASATPALWNPNAAAAWSLMFGPLFGAWLHMKNWQTMGDSDKAAQNKGWLIGTLCFYVLTLVLTLAFPESKLMDSMQRAAGLGLLIGWYYHVGKWQQATVLARYGKDYPRKGWLKPLGMAVLMLVALVALVTVATLASDV